MKAITTTLLLSAALMGCKKSNTQTVKEGFIGTPANITIKGGMLVEASGIADSKVNPGYLWVEEDSGNPSMIYVLGHDGTLGKGIPIQNSVNRDWEDISVAAGPVDGTSYVYLADIGDNNAVDSEYLFYRFAEPSINALQVTAYDKLRFHYPDGPHDAEAFVVDPGTKDIYVITKRDNVSGIYKIAYPQDTTNINNASLVSRLGFNGVTSAAVSPDGNEIIVKTYTTLYYFRRNGAEPVSATLSRTPTTLGYQLEPQGEAVSFATDNSGFYTLSEVRNNQPVTLNFYKRN